VRTPACRWGAAGLVPACKDLRPTASRPRQAQGGVCTWALFPRRRRECFARAGGEMSVACSSCRAQATRATGAWPGNWCEPPVRTCAGDRCPCGAGPGPARLMS